MARRADGTPDRTTAHEAFKRRQLDRTCLGVVAAVVLHVAFLAGFPALTAHDGTAEASSMEVLELPPQVVVPPPPERILRPAEPVIGEVDAPADATIPENADFLREVRSMPAPPRADAPADRPTWIPRDVDPRALNDGEITRLLQRLYPPALRQAGVSGDVTLWLFVSAEGRVEQVRIHEPSRYEAFDRAAVEAARQMEFAPARIGDRAIGVWVRRLITFSTE